MTTTSNTITTPKKVERTMAELVTKLKKDIALNNNVAIKALLTVYDHQTNEEQADGLTHEYNGVGFNSVDSDILTSLSVFYREKGYLSLKQLSIVQKKMPKYARQLIDFSIASGKIQKEGHKYYYYIY